MQRTAITLTRNRNVDQLTQRRKDINCFSKDFDSRTAGTRDARVTNDERDVKTFLEPTHLLHHAVVAKLFAVV